MDKSSKQRILELLTEKQKTSQSESEAEAIAIIGMGCRFPGADNPQSFWELLAQGRASIAKIPSHRWETQDFYDPDPEKPGYSYCQSGSFLKEIEQFDPEFFGIAPREAKNIDPMQLLLLEVAWETLEDAGLAYDSLEGSRTGVFLGIYNNDHLQLSMMAQELELINAHSGLGMLHSMAAGRIAHLFGWHGPALSLDTACSSSLVAVHLACESLLRHESDFALAGGVNLLLAPETWISLCKSKMIAPDGRCKTFDAAADGFGRGEGCGAVFLKRLSDAKRDGNRILAVIRGTGVNHDGRSASVTAPNGISQRKLIQATLKKAGFSGSEIDYLEAHGTGTALGDPIELNALRDTYLKERSAEKPLILGSVKTNLGHLEGAAGIASLIKVVLALQAGKIPPHLNFQTLNPQIEIEKNTILIPLQLMEWQSSNQPRRAAVSSFGISGTNAHAILEAAPKKQEALIEDLPVIVTGSARNQSAFKELALRYANFLAEKPLVRLADFSKTINLGRTHWEQRWAVVASDRSELLEKLNVVAAGNERTGVWYGKAGSIQPKIAFLFTGQGSQYVGMGEELYQTEPVFRAALDECATILGEILPHHLLEVLFGTGVDPEILHQTEYTQPALFALEYSLYQLWHSWGVEPEILLGHSVGEYVAACVAGVFGLEDGLRLIAQRGRLMQSLEERGAMAAVFASENRVCQELASHGWQVELAAINGPENVVISGAEKAVNEAVNGLSAQGLRVQRLEVSQGFHSAQLEPVLAELATAVAGMRMQRAQKTVISNLTGEIIEEELTQPNYWQRHARETVRFAQGMETLKAEGCQIFVELGPAPVLLGMGQRAVTIPESLWLSSLKRGNAESVQIRQALAALHTVGVKVNWEQYHRVHSGELIAVPTYPFQRIACQSRVAKQGRVRLKQLLQQRQTPSLSSNFLGKLTTLPQQKLYYENEIFNEGNSFYLCDHQLYERIVVPGAYYVALALTAAKELMKTAFEISGLHFAKALLPAVASSYQIHLGLTPDKADYQFEIYSRRLSKQLEASESAWEKHALGSWHEVAGESRPSLKLEELTARLSQSISGDEFYQKMLTRGFVLGEHFQWIESLSLGEDEVLAKMRAPQGEETELDALYYPGLLDACFQTMASCLEEQVSLAEGELYVPIAVEKILCQGEQLNGASWSYLKLTSDLPGEYTATINLYDQDGNWLLMMEGLQLARLSKELITSQQRASLYYQLIWEESQSRVAVPERASGIWLIFADQQGLGAAVAAQLQEAGASCQLIYREQLENQSLAQWFTDLSNVKYQGLLYLWGLESTAAELEEGLRLVSGYPVELLQASPETPLWLVTNGGQAVEQSKELKPLAALSWGLGRVMQLELPNSGGIIELERLNDLKSAAASLCYELQTASAKQVVWRGKQRFLPRLAKVLAPEVSVIPDFKQGSYLITGGLGELGLAVASWLIEHGAKEIVLLSRSNPAAETIERLQESASEPIAIIHKTCDVTDRDALAMVLQEIAQNMSPLQGIFHAAGVLEDCILLQTSWEQIYQVLKPKVLGALHLHQLTQELDLKYFVMFSSVAALLGSPGQGAYAAGNAYLDLLAGLRQQQGLPGISINWGPWSGGGMAADQRVTERLARMGLKKIDRKEGLQALGDALTLKLPNLTVLEVDWQILARQMGASGLRDLVRDFLPLKAELQVHDKAAFSREKLLALADAERKEFLASILREKLAEILEIDPSSFEMEHSLSSMGLDSLLSIELKTKLETLFQIKLSVATLLQGPSANQLVELILEQLAVVEATKSVGSLTENPVELIDQLDELSEAELDQLLAHYAKEEREGRV